MKCRPGVAALTVLAGTLLIALPMSAKKQTKSEKQQTSLDEYLSELATPTRVGNASLSGSIYTSTGLLADPYSDLRARKVGDPISIRITESTSITSSGSVNGERSFTTSSAITGLPAKLKTGGMNPLLGANSDTKLKGSGSTSSSSSLSTVLTAEVVSVLPNGSLVLEAQRQVLANNQHETVVLRGVVRPADIATDNSVHSYQLAHLQLEVKGKGVISDQTRPPNIIMRTLLRLIGF